MNDDLQSGIEKIVFADGTVWTASDLRSLLLGQAASTGDDLIVGFNVADTIIGGQGNDVINGGEGSDTYVYARGDGNDTITEDVWSGNTDRIVFTDINPADIIATFSGADLLIAIKESALELVTPVRSCSRTRLARRMGRAWSNFFLATEVL